jgi:tRNA(adenine34) deaminase
MKDSDWMREALRLAGEDPKEVPVGAVIVQGNRLLAGAHNRQAADRDALAHAEMLAIRRAQDALGTARLDGCTIYVTLEPCPMCAGAILLSGLNRCVFAAFDSQYGCCGSAYALPMDPVFPRRVDCEGGLLRAEAEALLNSFFRRLRENGETPPPFNGQPPRELYHRRDGLANP